MVVAFRDDSQSLFWLDVFSDGFHGSFSLHVLVDDGLI